jgi:trimethylamine---corrinoid protein Co-methyltransferase
MGLMGAALTKMGRFYDLPTSPAGCTADAKQPGPEAALEKLVTTFSAVSTGAYVILGFGEMESDQLLDLEQIVVDNELVHYCEHIYNGVDSSAAKDLSADIAQVGPGGNYLK